VPLTPPTGRRSGFTLVELLGVMVVLGLMSSVIYVTWQSMLPRADLNKAVRELAATIHGVRSDAITRSAPFEILYDFDGTEELGPGYSVVTPFRKGGGLLSLSGDAELDEDLLDERIVFERTVLPESVRFKSLFIDGIEYTSGQVPVRFDALGTTSSHVIVLEQPLWESQYTIEVLGLTGLLRFHDGEFIREFPDQADFE